MIWTCFLFSFFFFEREKKEGSMLCSSDFMVIDFTRCTVSRESNVFFFLLVSDSHIIIK